MKLVTVMVDAPLHKDSDSDTFSAPGSASDENLGKLLDRNLDEGNSRLLVTGRLAQDKEGNILPESSQAALGPATVLVLGPLVESDVGQGKPAGKADAGLAPDGGVKPSVDPTVYEKLKTGTIAFAGPKFLVDEEVAAKLPDLTVDLTGKLVTDRDLGLDRAKVMVKGAVLTKEGKVRPFSFCYSENVLKLQ